MIKLKDDYLVSVCVPIYNVENYIQRCAESLFKQTYSNIEFVFVDDCSPDNSISILQKTAMRFPHRMSQMRIIKHDKNMGLGHARNTAVAESMGLFLLHVDSDDYVDINVVEELVKEQEKDNSDIVSFPRCILFNGFHRIVSPAKEKNPSIYLNDILSGKKSANVWGALIRTSLYKSNNIKVEYGVNQSEDLQVFPRLLYYSQKISYIDNSYYYYDRTRELSYCNNFSEKSLEQVFNTYKVLDDFFISKNEQNLVACIKNRKIIVLCRNKMEFARDANKKMYNFVCNKIEEYKNEYNSKLSFKYRMIVELKNYTLFRLFIYIIKR